MGNVQLFATPWTAACQASLSLTISCSLPKFRSVELVMPSNHLILCRPLLLLPSIFPSIRVFYFIILLSLIVCSQASLTITNSWSLPKLLSVELVMPSNHLILCHPLLLLSSIFPNVKLWTAPSRLALVFWLIPLCLGEGNGTPLQYSCLENPMDGGAW